MSVDTGIPKEEERIEIVLVHQGVGESAASLRLRAGEAAPHQLSCSRSQSATSGRYLQGTSLQTWLPFSSRTKVAFGAASAILFDSRQFTRRSSLPATISSGCSMRSATPLRSSSDAFARASCAFAAPV